MYYRKNMENTIRNITKGRTYKALIILLSIIYVISPIDLVPDVPPVGWSDDIAVLLLTLFYVFYVLQGKDDVFSNLFSTLKWAVALGGILIVLLLALLVLVAVSLIR